MPKPSLVGQVDGELEDDPVSAFVQEEKVAINIQLMRTLDKMPEKWTILMKLLYYDDATLVDYGPPFFRGYTEEEVNNPWTKNTMKMEVGNVNNKHLVLALKVRENDTPDPIEDEEQFRQVKEWISSYHLGTNELTYVLSNFYDISVV
ncbi:hypothetical protein AgCh_010582 [Apium graveolens]